MASLHKQGGNRPGYKLRFRDGDGRQRVLWLGDVSKRNAETVAYHVSELVRAYAAGVAPEVGTAKWANELSGRIRDRLAGWGLVCAERNRRSGDAVRLVGPFFDAYIASRTDLKPTTVYKYQQAAGYFTKFVGGDRLLADITPADVDAWRLWLTSEALAPTTDDAPGRGLAIATANKHAKRVKKLLAHAVRAKLIAESPASDQRIGPEVNRDRDFYVTRAVASKVLAECDVEWALIFGLCRFAGLRCPTEVLSLTWADVDWAAGRLRIDSVKTGLRYCPIFPELRPLLDAAFDAAPDRAVHCIQRYRGNETNLRTQLHRVLKRAGVVPWEKAFVNLRASCRTDLQEHFPDHAINSWLGHSSRVAERHYLQTTEEHWQRAITKVSSPTSVSPAVPGSSAAVVGGNAGGNISANPLESDASTNEKIPGETAGEGARFPGILCGVPPQGLEPWTR
jgi:integrase